MLFSSTPGPGPIYTLIERFTPKSMVPPSHLTSWVPGFTQLSTQKEVVVAIGTYLLVIFGGRELMRNRPAFKLQTLFQIHNLILTAGSGLLLALMLEEIIPLYWKNSFFYSICSPSAYTPRLVSYYMINYYIKYVELIDTVFLVLKKKPLAFLHVFHHAATAILCFTQLEGETSVQWVVIVLNLWVHVIMYYYYYATAGGAKIWWKKYLTTMQITQFVIDLFITYFASYAHFVFKYIPFMPSVGDCSGSEGAAAFGCALLTSYLFLFIHFYRKTYKAGAAKRAAGVRGSAKSKVVIQDARRTTIVTEL